jgi:hypothetical protein
VVPCRDERVPSFSNISLLSVQDGALADVKAVALNAISEIAKQAQREALLSKTY